MHSKQCESPCHENKPCGYSRVLLLWPIVLADDLGYNELNFMNGTRGIHTPALDQLAHSGVMILRSCGRVGRP